MSVVKRIVRLLPLGEDEVKLLIWTAPSRYKVHSIEKRGGRGQRVIAQPTAEVKILQRLMVAEVVAKLPVSVAAKAYRQGIGIVDHASAHARGAYLLKLDFENFFPSIRGADFLRHLSKYSNTQSDDAKDLARLFFWRPRGTRELLLSIGAPSSPAISNTMLFDFDEEMLRFCGERGVVYTRYADDLAFSTSEPNILAEVYKHVVTVCESLKYPRLRLNQNKTVFTSKKFSRQLTGLVLSNDGRASLGRDKKRLLRSMASHFAKGDLPAEDVGKLRGWLAFALSVDSAYVDTIRAMIGEAAYTLLMKGK